MPVNYNSNPYSAIGQGLSDFGAGVGRFLEKNGIKKSRLAHEREESARKKETERLIEYDRRKEEGRLKGIRRAKRDILTQQLSDEDSDLKAALISDEDRNFVPDDDQLTLYEAEIRRRSAERVKTNAESEKAEKFQRRQEAFRKRLTLRPEMPAALRQGIGELLDGSEEGLNAAEREFEHWKPEKIEQPKPAKVDEDDRPTTAKEMIKDARKSFDEHQERYYSARKSAELMGTSNPVKGYSSFGEYLKDEYLPQFGRILNPEVADSLISSLGGDAPKTVDAGEGQDYGELEAENFFEPGEANYFDDQPAGPETPLQDRIGTAMRKPDSLQTQSSSAPTPIPAGEVPDELVRQARERLERINQLIEEIERGN